MDALISLNIDLPSPGEGLPGEYKYNETVVNVNFSRWKIKKKSSTVPAARLRFAFVTLF